MYFVFLCVCVYLNFHLDLLAFNPKNFLVFLVRYSASNKFSQFCLSGVYFWKTVLLDMILSRQFFSFSILNMLSHRLLGFIVSDAKLMLQGLMYVMNNFLIAFKIFSLSFSIFTVVCLKYKYLWLYSTWNLLSFLDV